MDKTICEVKCKECSQVIQGSIRQVHKLLKPVPYDPEVDDYAEILEENERRSDHNDQLLGQPGQLAPHVAQCPHCREKFHRKCWDSIKKKLGGNNPFKYHCGCLSN